MATRPPTIAQARFFFFRSEAQIANEFDQGTIDVRDVAGADLVQLSDITSVDQLQRRFPQARVARPGRLLAAGLRSSCPQKPLRGSF